MDLAYYKHRTVRIYPNTPSGNLPGNDNLHPFLACFGAVRDLRRFCIKEGESVNEPPNNAIAIFDSPDAVERILKSSKDAMEGSLWRKRSITAESFRESGPLDNFFAKRLFPRLSSKFTGESSSSKNPPQFKQSRTAHSDSGGHGPPAKRPRTEGWNRELDVAATAGNHASRSKSSQISSAIPESPDWMRARIIELEAELDTAKAARDMAASEQEVIRKAHQAEQRARREAMAQKSAAEAALSRKAIEHDRLRSDLETTSVQKSALSNELSSLRGELAAARYELGLMRSSSDQSTSCGEQIKAQEMELEEARDQVHKLRLQNSRLGQHKTYPNTTEPEDTSAKIKDLKSEVKQLKYDLTNTQEQLDSTQQSLESMEQKYSSARGKYKSAKTDLKAYKTQLEKEQTLMNKLKDKLTPAVYQSLGVTHETLGVFLSAMGLLPTNEEGNTELTEESG
ncbi:unnamed protein product [Rhizoctonia solani]|uniref:Uncharacterized protein n=1 Tax=Rhizoctonia solani TaxID=456999 RepID=A0A8H3DPI7_9AGAM|nr:unnamed protein product [Rhizoctonia solani]